VGKKKESAQQSYRPPVERRVLIAYYLTLAAFFIASFFPEARLWGINWWAYYPLWAKFALLISGALVPPMLWRWGAKWSDPQKDISDRAYWLISLGLLIAFGLLFYLLRARTHFLGDGYSLLSVLSSDQAVIKPRNFGAMTLHHYLATVIGDRTEAAVLLSYQITSFTAGMLYIGSLLLAVRRLLSTNRERILYVIAACTGGYMLQFFGYVENYDLLLVAVLLHTLAGTLGILGRVSRIWTILVQALAILIHIFGVMLLPATVYVLVRDTRLWVKLKSMSPGLKWTLTAAIAAAAVTVFAYTFATNYFFQFALVPPLLNRLTIQGYTLFSTAHLLDFANLIIMLIPGLPCLILGLGSKSGIRLADGGFQFLLITTVCCLGGVFIFDPKLGMARDWDLFAYCGIPLAAALLHLLFQTPSRVPKFALITLVVIIQTLSLIPRVVAQVIPDLAIAHFKSCVLRDYDKSLTSRLVLVEYYKKRLDLKGLEQLTREGWGNLPAIDDTLAQAVALVDEGRVAQAKSLLEWVVSRRPASADAWSNLGRCYFFENDCDSAVLCYRIADGLNPYSKVCMYNVGQGYFCLHDLDAAEEWFKSSLKYDSLFSPSLIGLALCYRDTDRWERYGETIAKLARAQNGDAAFLLQSIELLITHGQVAYAAQALRTSVGNGLDTTSVRELINKYPQLDTLM